MNNLLVSRQPKVMDLWRKGILRSSFHGKEMLFSTRSTFNKDDDSARSSTGSQYNGNASVNNVRSALVSSMDRVVRSNDQYKAIKEIRNQKKIHPHFVRNFQDATIYDPADFSMGMVRKNTIERQRNRRSKYPAGSLMSLWKDPITLSQYMTVSGSILPSHITKLDGKTHKKVAKQIRRCRAAGLLSFVHKSVELLPHEPRIY